MRSPFFKYSALLLCAAPSAFAFSLYDTAPAVGLPESHAIRYSLNTRIGYDTNPGCRVLSSDKKGSAYANASLSATYSDVEATDQITYTARLGATHYFDAESGAHNGQKWHGDCTLGATWAHAFSGLSRNSLSVRLTYKPEPDYDDGISAHSRRGDCFTWSLHDVYSQAIDSRWSWNVGGSYSGTRYDGSERGYGHYNDDRQYVTGFGGISYRASSLTTYNLNASASRRLRTHGLNSNSYTLTAGVSHAIDTTSSFSVNVGIQDVAVSGDNRISPTFNAAYNRKVTEGLSMRAYVRFSNENTDSYRGSNRSYKDVLTWRIGADATYTISPDLNVRTGASVLFASYRGGQTGLATESRDCYDVHVSLNYKFSNSLSGDISCRYNTATYDRKARTDSYDRVEMSCGLSYHF